MKSILFQEGAARVAFRDAALLHRPRLRQKMLRLRRKIPSWTGLLLLVVFADTVLAMLAWVAVDIILH